MYTQAMYLLKFGYDIQNNKLESGGKWPPGVESDFAENQ